MQKAEQNVNVVKSGAIADSTGKKILVKTSVKWTANIRSKKSRKLPIRTIETNFFVSNESGVFEDDCKIVMHAIFITIIYIIIIRYKKQAQRSLFLLGFSTFLIFVP